MSEEVKKPRLVKLNSDGSYEPVTAPFCELLDMFIDGYYADVSFELSTPATGSTYEDYDPGDGGYVEASGDSSVSIAKIREKFRLSKSDFDAVMDILKYDLDDYPSVEEHMSLEDYILSDLIEQTEGAGPQGFSIESQSLEFVYVPTDKVIKMTYTVDDCEFDESEYKQYLDDCNADDEYDSWRDEQLFEDD